MKVFKAETSPDGRAEDEIAVTCAVDHPHLIRVLALVAQPHAMIVDRVMGSPVPQIRHSGSPSPATPLRPLPPRRKRALRSWLGYLPECSLTRFCCEHGFKGAEVRSWYF